MAKRSTPKKSSPARGKAAARRTSSTAAKRAPAVKPSAKPAPKKASAAQAASASPAGPDGSLLVRSGPALGLLELSSVARGLLTADAMAKRAAVELVLVEAITPGKLVILIAGGEEEVSQAMAAGLALAQDTLLDQLLLSKADPQLAPALSSTVRAQQVDSLAVVETFSVASAVLAADRAVKAAQVTLVQLRLARGLGGRAFFTLSGELSQIEAAVEAARELLYDGMLLGTEIIPRPHPDLVQAILAPPRLGLGAGRP